MQLNNEGNQPSIARLYIFLVAVTPTLFSGLILPRAKLILVGIAILCVIAFAVTISGLFLRKWRFAAWIFLSQAITLFASIIGFSGSESKSGVSVLLAIPFLIGCGALVSYGKPQF